MASGLPHGRRKSRSSRSDANGQVLQLKDSSTPLFPSFENGDHGKAKASPSKHDSGQTSFPIKSPSRRSTPADRTDSNARPRSGTSVNNLSGLVCNVHRTTGQKPPGLSGASTTVVGDTLYVFGGQEVESKHVTRTMYQLDLVQRHWTKLRTNGDLPAERYFHSMCALGDTKLVLFGGQSGDGTNPSEKKSILLADLYTFDIATSTWTYIVARNQPAPRYAHCATILPSSASFTSTEGHLSALRHNVPSNTPNTGTLGVQIDGTGGAEMIVFGGQLKDDQHLGTVDVLNLRNMTWTSSKPIHAHKCGAYRSAAATVPPSLASGIGVYQSDTESKQGQSDAEEDEDVSGAPAILYSNYQFMNVIVQVLLRRPDGSVQDLEQRGPFNPPGLRFPSAGMIGSHLIVSGVFMRASEEEYQLWAFDLQNLTWSRIDLAGGVFNSGSWGRGLPWAKKNAYIVLGDRARPFKQDYNQRRTNFKNLCVIELEAFGLYTDPHPTQELRASPEASPVPVVDSGEAIGSTSLGMLEVSDMEILAIDGEKVPINSKIVSERWGPYFQHLISEDLGSKVSKDSAASDASSLRPSMRSGARSRNSNITITGRNSVASATGTLVNGGAPSIISDSSGTTIVDSARPLSLSMKQPVLRSRALFLPHVYHTIRALVQYLYTGFLPPVDSHFCTPQILCSLLQIARPYRVNGLLEATVHRLHQVLDGRNAPAIFNAAAMAAGGGNAVKLAADPGAIGRNEHDEATRVRQQNKLRTTDSMGTIIHSDSETDASESTTSSMTSSSEAGGHTEPGVWTGGWSAVVGLQKRGLRSLMDGKRIRERARSEEDVGPSNHSSSLASPAS